ncbi:hypothetical protein ABC345_18180 [Shouchella sp. 1P09AA]|uniref:hypothetical protein n=1 Tax=unclassified Shouchella TaxID=2893065 RepID=UPI00399F75E4
MKIIKGIAPFGFMAVLLVVLDLFSYDEELTRAEEVAIEGFHYELEAEQEKMDTLRNALGDTAFNQQADQIVAQYEANETIHVTVIGSDVHEGGEDMTAWYQQAEKALNDYYGEDAFSFSFLEPYKGYTSADVVQSDMIEDLKTGESDMIVLEPFLLNDTRLMAPEDTVQFTDEIIQEIQTERYDAFLMLQPANPIASPTAYQEQVDAIAHFASENDVAYLDHWSAWPSTNDEAIHEYIVENDMGTVQPNQQGHDVWSDAFVQFLTAE